MIQVYSIKELVQVSGVARTTIHFYLRQGLLPRAQKTAASRSLYTQEHVDILGRIAELKDQGRSLARIESALRDDLHRARETAIDLASQERERLHARILAAAADEFACKGYRNTHVTAIMRDLGITATLFYSHFPSKRALLAECVEFLARLEAPSGGASLGIEDEVEQVLRAIAGRARVLELVMEAGALRELEGDDGQPDLRESIRLAIAPIVEAIEQGLGRRAHEDAGERGVPDNLIAQTLYGAFEYVAHAPLPTQRSRQDLLKAFLWLFLAARAAGGGGRVDIQFARYEALIRP